MSEMKKKVEAIVRQIPVGRVMTYGQLAALAGSPRAARVVGGIAHFGDSELPWQRVVNKQGGLASGYPGGRRHHAEHLRAEGVEVTEHEQLCRVDVESLLWWPEQTEKGGADHRACAWYSGLGRMSVPLATRLWPLSLD